MRYVISLYDYTGEAVRPWAVLGFHCYCYDIQHSEVPSTITVGRGLITFLKADLQDPKTIETLKEYWQKHDVAFMSAFPVCTDLAVSGARHFKAKAEKDPEFQIKAASYAMWCADLGDHLGCPYYIENPVSRLATLWRKPDHTFNPCDFGGYISAAEADHPWWPEYIAPRDAYTKKTCLWVGGGFVFPQKLPVTPVTVSYTKADGTITTGSQQFGKLGGKSQRTKDIRSATPRGFARAVLIANLTAKKSTSIAA